MPAYSLQHDPPWITEPAGGASYAPTESVYSEDYDGVSYYDHPDMPSVPPLRVKKPQGPSDHAHPQQRIQDIGPQVRQSRLPIFKQVRSMLQRPSRIDPTNVKYDEFSGDISENGRAPELRPSTYQPTFPRPFEARRTSPRRPQQPPRSVRSLSPVSILRDEEVQRYSPQIGWDHDRPPSPVSPVSEVSEDEDRTPVGPSEVAVNARANPQTPPHSQMNAIKRKPVSSRLSSSPENVPPHTSHGVDFSRLNDSENRYNSHFSWTTVAPSIAPTRPSTDTRQSPQVSEHAFPQSRFSWSTVNTSATNQMRAGSPPPSPPPAIPPQYRTPPVQSILSRHRPVQRLEKEVWTPTIRKPSLPVSRAATPTSAKSKLSIEPPPHTSTGTGSAKRLPPPPQLLTPTSPMSRLETLITEEQDKQQQRRNIQKAIADYTRVELASPMDVSFAQLREAQQKLGELRTTLAEVLFEEREIGIAISRARRKEGEEEGLWVRRVTG